MKDIKISTTLYLKEFEKDDLIEIIKIKNEERIKANKKPKPNSDYIHEILQKGIRLEKENIMRQLIIQS